MKKILLTTILALLWFVPVTADDNCVEKILKLFWTWVEPQNLKK